MKSHLSSSIPAALLGLLLTPELHAQSTAVTYQGREGPQSGFVAQDLRDAVPEAVNEGKEGTLHAAYARIIPLLVEAIKEQNQKSEASSQQSEAGNRKLEQKLRQKDAKIAKLQKRLHRLEQLIDQSLKGNER